ncbi:universal stress protein, partial [Gemmatimonadota bacterium]
PGPSGSLRSHSYLFLSMSRVILVATDGTPAALGAFRLAAALEQQQGARVEVIGVVEPVPVFDAGFMVALPEVELYESRQEALRHEIERQVEAVGGNRTHWPVSVEAGLPGPRIVRRAGELGADTIFLGLGRHRPLDRMFGTETALQVIRVSHIPVLAVPEAAQGLPRFAVLGVDFSLFSQRAAQVAISLMRAPWEVHLTHVMSGMEFLPTLSEEWRSDYEDEIRGRLSEFAAGIETEGGNSVHLHILEGEPAHEILGFSEGKGADLLVAGSHGHSFVGRLLMGSVSTRLIRGAHIPVLVVPPLDRTEEVLSEKGVEEGKHPWVRQLNDFTRENAGRLTTLEFDEPELGPQECGKDLPLQGVDYDPRKDCIEIMLGRSGTGEGHLTHSIPAPVEVEVVRGEDGRAEALQILLPQGRAVLRIHRT